MANYGMIEFSNHTIYDNLEADILYTCSGASAILSKAIVTSGRTRFNKMM